MQDMKCLCRLLLAGLLLLVPFVAAAQEPAAARSQEEKPKAAAANPDLLDLNAATVEQLQKLPGIGKVTAEAIVRFREKSGPFRRVEELLAVRGITKKRLEKIRPLVTVKLTVERWPEAYG